MRYLFFYLIFINIFSGALFVVDKFNSGRKNAKRFSEYNLHILELLGGVFIIFPLIHIIRHKSRKIKYNFITILILFLWIILLYFLFNYFDLEVELTFVTSPFAGMKEEIIKYVLGVDNFYFL